MLARPEVVEETVRAEVERQAGHLSEAEQAAVREQVRRAVWLVAGRQRRIAKLPNL